MVRRSKNIPHITNRIEKEISSVPLFQKNRIEIHKSLCKCNLEKHIWNLIEVSIASISYKL